jgi:hypothetical protein
VGLEDAPHQVRLPEPRALDDTERALLTALVSGPRGRRELVDQASSAQVVGECSCGCASVWLRADDTVPSLATTAAESPTGDPGYYSLTAHGVSGDIDVQVTLHVAQGRLEELEIWAGAEGERVLPDPASLHFSRDD